MIYINLFLDINSLWNYFPKLIEQDYLPKNLQQNTPDTLYKVIFLLTILIIYLLINIIFSIAKVISVSPNGDMVATGGTDGSIYLRYADDLEKLDEVNFE